ncbi:MAG: PSD1 and planctomycete cytochrome C domain-containing protein, partial [Limisphaerales bacterium]
VFVFTAAAESPESAGIEFFENKIRPIFIDHCYSCHSQESGKSRGSLLLDTKDNLRKGGDSGVVIVPGDPEKSLLIKAVRYADPNLQMPPKGEKLSAEQVAALEEWVRIGAPDPRVSTGVDTNSIAAKSETHWAFQPVANPTVPEVKNKRWVKTPIDAFILKELEAKKLKPSSEADKRTLIRRAYYDLTGLPPSAEQVEKFVKDRSKNAFEKVIDELLSSPQYGERWGRHWLDVARYADTKGYLAGNQERRFPFSWTYRDWVIRAFNEDLPYDQFLIQQIAADHLDLGEDKRPLAAMGFLTLGRRFLNNKHDIIDDRIDVVTRGTMALTVSCARCHDHKYDPVSAKDYYSLYGVFDSSEEPKELPLLGMKSEGEQFTKYLEEKKKREETLKTFRDKKVQEVLSESRKQAGEYLRTALEIEQMEDKSKAETIARERKLDPGLVTKWRQHLERWSTPTNAIFGALAEYRSIPAEQFEDKAPEVTAKLLANETINPFVREMVEEDGGPKSFKEVVERYGKLFTSTREAWHQFLAEHGKDNPPGVMPTALPDNDREQVRQLLYGDASPFTLSGGEVERLFDVPSIERVRELRRQVDELEALHPAAPPRAMALVDKGKPANPFVFIRGNPGNRGPDVPRQFLEIIAGEERKPFEKGSGRLEMAQAIASRDNPLTSRVIVNRVWMHHFGKGLVTTPSDFGLRSDPPSHPELLDWLAWNFMENGWSLKKLHRQIMLSAVYQQSSADNADAAAIDPNNTLLWKMNRQRLQFEALRDSLLAASGKLETTMGGQPVNIVAEPFSGRRSVYGYIDRQNLPGVFRTFDFANPDSTAPQRFYTTVPQQALFMLNSPFVVTQARNLLTNTEASKLSSDKARIEFLYKRVFQREPDKEEVKLGTRFIKEQVEKAPEPESKSPWQYGYGRYDATTNRVTRFTPFPHFTGKRWQGSAQFPDSKIGYVMLDIEGGHPGSRTNMAAIRRWVAPFDGKIKVDGELFHLASQGDGVLGRIVSSRHGELAHWVSFNGKVPTAVET